MRTALEFPRTDGSHSGCWRQRPWAAALVLVLLGAALAVPALASEPNADALVTRGLELRRKGQAVEALELFQKAHAIEPTPRTFGQMGLVEASLQRWIDAETHLGVALEASADTWVDGNHKLLDKALALARQHIGELVVEGPSGAHVQISGHGMKILPLAGPIRLAEGEVRVSAIAAGYKQLIQVVRIEAGKRTSLTLNFVPYHPDPFPGRNIPPGSDAPGSGPQRR